MTTATLTRRASETSRVPVRARAAPCPLLVATDGSRSADAALAATHQMAARTGQLVTLVAVHDPVPLVSPEVHIAVAAQTDIERRAAIRADVESQLQRLRIDARWPLRIITGDPAATIVSIAKDIGAELVIMGLGEHGLFDRMLGDETVIKVLRLGTIPVLAVAPGLSGLPRKVLAAVDFSASSARAVRLAGVVASGSSRFTVAHVITKEVDPLNWTAPDAAYSGSVGRAFDRLIAEAQLGDGRVITRNALHGEPTRELLRLVEEMQPDLIVVGSHGRNFLTRLRLGSVSTAMVRKARCSILVAPPEHAPDYIEEMPEVRGRFAFYEWGERLEEFTRRNRGRVARLEEIDPDLGAQVQENHVPFQGASFDPRDGRVHLMFASAAGHLTRSIGGVTGIQMLRDWSGGDAFLRVAHGRGQTLLTLGRS